MVRVAILWHMHQPSYRDPIDGTFVLPWVRLHALKDYWGMVSLLQEFPSVHVTINVVPSLLDQIEQYASGAAREPMQELALKRAEDLTLDERLAALQVLFIAHERNLIGRFPRYAQLLEQRGASREETALRAAVTRFSIQDFLDLQLLSKLAWFDYDLREKDLLLRQLVVKGSAYSEEDKAHLAQRERALLAEVLPAYKAAAASGQVELSTSPYYHPILPLLCDTESHHEACPGAALPRRYRHPEDASDQIERALSRHAGAFGDRPRGLWPSEGAVSDEMAGLVAKAGLAWIASDESVLERSAGRPIHRDSRGTVHPLDLLYRPWVRRTTAGDLTILFRDRALSDLIGFSYSSLAPQAAANDLLERLRRVGESWERQGLAGDPIVPIILDGENAWEYFRESGRVFLRAVYDGLANDPALRATTFSEAIEGAAPSVLPRVFAGSWIHANFSVWIGHPDDHRAWDQLGLARDAIESAAAQGAAPPEAIERAREIFRAACGSDWCWWYGEEHASENDIQFDLLYRRHLRAIYGAIGLPAPDALDEPLITTRKISVRHSKPTGAVRPVLDGRFTSATEWIAAGVYRATTVGGSMQRGSQDIRVVRFGTGDDNLHLLIETARPIEALLQEGELHVSFPGPTTARYRIHRTTGAIVIERSEKTSLGWVTAKTAAVVRCDSVLECSIPLPELRPAPGRELAFRLLLLNAGIEVERHPEIAPIRFEIEDVTRDPEP
jgi:alpha-amylase/alpha-mannosidase (GH57 family)